MIFKYSIGTLLTLNTIAPDRRLKPKIIKVMIHNSSNFYGVAGIKPGMYTFLSAAYVETYYEPYNFNYGKLWRNLK